MSSAGLVTVRVLGAAAVAVTLAACGEQGPLEGAPTLPTEHARTDCPELGGEARDAAAPGSQRAPVPIGFNSHAALGGALEARIEAELQRTAGSALWRVALDWRFAEAERGKLSFEAHDAIYCEALAHDIAPLLHITGAPEWASDESGDCPVSSCIDPPRTDALPALRRFAETVARRYPHAAAIEAWNEPNLATFWTDPDPERYTAVLAAIAGGVNDAGGTMPVLGGSLSSTTRTAAAGSRKAFDEFLTAMYAAGADDHMNALAFHPYPVSPVPGGSARSRPGDAASGERFTRAMEALRRVMRRAGDDERRIWITEVGIPVGPEISELEQARTLERIYDRLASAADVDAVVFHTLLEGHDEAGSGLGFGWVEPDGGAFRPRPVYCTFADRFGDPIPCDEPLTP